MDVANMKSLIKKNIIDFSELVLNNYNCFFQNYKSLLPIYKKSD